MSMSQGLKFQKFDLHVHTPASNDYRKKEATAADIVAAAVSKGVRGIAVTDHNTGAWIDQIKSAAQESGLVVFPGVEIKVHGGEHGIHLVALFDVDKSTAHVTAFLNTLKVYEHRGDHQHIAANCTVVDVARELQEFDASAVLILAHCTSNSGLISDMRGSQRSEVFRPEWRCLLGAEAPETDFTDTEKIKKHTRVVDLLDGGYDSFHFKRMAVYQASDSHHPDTIGDRPTYFKVQDDDAISLEDIRQCLIDRETRIRQSFEFTAFTYPKIEVLHVKGGFLDGQMIDFHEGLNSILGAKGSGKSLTVEFIRFALNQPPQDPDLLAEHERKLSSCLKVYGEVNLQIRDETGKQYKIRRIYDPANGNPCTIMDLSDGTEKEIHIEQSFPVLALSQNEVIKIAEDRTGRAQRRFIDNFFDFYTYQSEIQKLNDQLKAVDAKLSDSLRAHVARLSVQKQIATTKESADKISRQISNEVFERYAKKEKVGQAIQGQTSFLGSVKDVLVTNRSEIESLTPPVPDDQDVPANPAYKRAQDVTASALEELVRTLSKAEEDLERKIGDLTIESNTWKKEFEPLKQKYEAAVKESGGNQVSLEQKRKRYLVQLTTLNQQLTGHEKRANLLKELAQRRNDLIVALEAAYRNYFQARKERCDFFTANSNETIEVVMKEREDTSEFRNNLSGFKKGSYLRETDIDRICECVAPRDFISAILKYEVGLRAKPGSLSDIAKDTGIKLENVEKLVVHMLEEHSYEEILALLYSSVPQDTPEISYRIGSVFRPLSELSVGQKSVALLIVALSDGAFPIIIDQPEDSLDLRSIWDDVCKKLRDSKDQRQFIFTTHNSSVAVASDSDIFTILQATDTNGQVLYSGSINRGNIRQEVINYLEGGKNTYELKRSKYNL